MNDVENDENWVDEDFDAKSIEYRDSDDDAHDNDNEIKGDDTENKEIYHEIKDEITTNPEDIM